VLLAIPTAVYPDGPLAGPTYLAGLTLVVAALWWGSLRLGGTARAPWLLAASAASCWLGGDALQRVLEHFGRFEGRVGPQDALWLASYPLLVAAVIGMIRARGLPVPLLREIRLDVVVVAAAAGVGAWHLLVQPSLGEGGPLLTTVVWAIYPLADVAVFAFGLTLILAPGRRSAPGVLVIACLGLTLPLDFLHALLPIIAPNVDAARLDGGLCVVNGLLGAAAVHPYRTDLTAAPALGAAPTMHRWRVVLLGTSLCAVSLVGAAPTGGAIGLVPSLIAGVVVSVTIVVRFYRVVRERERAEAALAHQAHHDQLTGAANRTLLARRLADCVRGGRSPGPSPEFALIFIDLDGFKGVNDAHGHPTGDAVLRTVAERLVGLVRSTDTVARVGGDEFVLLCHTITEPAAERLGHRVAETIRRPIDIGALSVEVGVSVGVLATGTALVARQRDRVLLPEGAAAAADDLLRTADSAMYAAKRAGGGVRMARC
jgi:diguanylate cyclase (GGDEF)-like protein